MLTKKNRVWAMAAVVVAVAGFSACLKTPDPGPPARPVASVVVLNASTHGAGFDLYDNGQKLGDGKTALGLGFTSPYPAYGGAHVFTFKKSGADSTVGTTNIMLDSLSYYTVMAYGQSPVKVVSFSDDVSNVKDNKVYYRVFHLSPNAGPVDIYIDNKKIDSSRTYEDKFPRGFTALDLTSAAELIVKEAGTTKELAKASNSSLKIPLSQGGVYTIYIAGLKDNLDAKKLFVNTTYGAVNLNR